MAKKLSPEELEEKKKLKKARIRRLESCLTLARSYYVQNQAMFESYVKQHRAAQMPAADAEMTPELEGLAQVAQGNQNSLLKMINADQILNC